MSIVVRAFPVAGSIEKVEDFARELKSRRSEAADFYGKYGVTHESWHMQQTPAGPMVIVVNVVEDPREAAPRYAASTEAFESWFKGAVLEATGIDATREPLGPPTTLLYDWTDDRQPELCDMMKTAVLA